MAGKVFFSVTMSLDGFIAPEGRMDAPDSAGWRSGWNCSSGYSRSGSSGDKATNPCCSRDQHDQTSDPEAGI